MAKEPEKAKAGSPLAPRIVGYAGLALSVAGAVACLVLFIIGLTRGEKGGAWVLHGLLFSVVAALGVWLFYDFLRLRDWTLESAVPQGARLLGHVSRVVGSLAAAGCVALIVLMVVLPKNPTPKLPALFVLGFFVSLFVRYLGSSVAEGRRWAFLALPALTGLLSAVFVVALILGQRGAAVITLTIVLLLYFVVKLFVLLPRFAEEEQAAQA